MKENKYISWYDLVKEIYNQVAYKTKIIPVTTDEYGLNKAIRPLNSRLERSKIIEKGFILLSTWKDALDRYLKEIKQI